MQSRRSLKKLADIIDLFQNIFGQVPISGELSLCSAEPAKILEPYIMKCIFRFLQLGPLFWPK